MPESKPYHHGSLREALLQASIHLIAERGPSGFTLREVARRAGVSHNAPYRHFRDKDDLMGAVAAQGFRELTQAMLEEAASKSNGRDRLKHSGLAYVSFALRRPEHFAVMFDLPASKSQRPEYIEASTGAFAALLGFVEDCQNEGQLPSGRSRDRALLAWSLVHGIAKLAVTGRLAGKSSINIMEFAAFAIDESFAAYTPATTKRKDFPTKPTTRS
jgi:AcrR family transcriptional regulator